MDLATVVAQMDRLGPVAYLATSDAAGAPHVVPVSVTWSDEAIYSLVGVDDVKVRNIRSRPETCLHYGVAEATGWDSLIVWARAAVLTGAADKRRLWNHFTYDLDEFEPGGPDNSPDSCLIELRPYRAVLLERFGLDGRDTWTAVEAE